MYTAAARSRGAVELFCGRWNDAGRDEHLAARRPEMRVAAGLAVRSAAKKCAAAEGRGVGCGQRGGAQAAAEYALNRCRRSSCRPAARLAGRRGGCRAGRLAAAVQNHGLGDRPRPVLETRGGAQRFSGSERRAASRCQAAAAQLLPLAQRLRRLRVAVTASGARHADLHYVRDVHAGGRRGSGSGAGCPDGRVRPTVCAAAQHACRLARLTGRRGRCCAGWPVAAGQHHTTGSLPRCAYDSGDSAQRFSGSGATGQAG